MCKFCFCEGKENTHHPDEVQFCWRSEKVYLNTSTDESASNLTSPLEGLDAEIIIFWDSPRQDCCFDELAHMELRSDELHWR